QLGGVEEWIRQELWPALPPFVRLVLAGRRAPSARWLCDPAWQRGAEAVELGGLTREESRQLFLARGARAESVGAVWRRTSGHPLALTLAAGIVERGEGPSDILDHSDVIET